MVQANRKLIALAFSGLCCIIATVAALAQQAPRTPPAATQNAPAQTPSPPPVTGPETTSATFGDWVMRCSTTQAGKLCEMVQTLQIQNQAGQQTPFAVLALGRAGKGEPLKFITQLPSNITIANGIIVETKPDRPLTGSYTRCLPIGCFAEVVVPDEVRRRWATRNEAGTVRFHDGSNQQITLPVSFRGFSLAIEAMQKEAP